MPRTRRASRIAISSRRTSSSRAMPDGEQFPKLLDFGIAKLLGPELDASDARFRTATGIPIGTPYYMSPEQCRGKDVDHRTDIYSFGIVAFRLLTGTYPFDGDDYVELLFKQVNDEPPLATTRNPALPQYVADAIALDDAQGSGEPTGEPRRGDGGARRWCARARARCHRRRRSRPMRSRRRSVPPPTLATLGDAARGEGRAQPAVWIGGALVLVCSAAGAMLVMNHAPASSGDASPPVRLRQTARGRLVEPGTWPDAIDTAAGRDRQCGQAAGMVTLAHHRRTRARDRDARRSHDRRARRSRRAGLERCGEARDRGAGVQAEDDRGPRRQGSGRRKCRRWSTSARAPHRRHGPAAGTAWTSRILRSPRAAIDPASRLVALARVPHARGSSRSTPACGNGVVEPGEDCDSGANCRACSIECAASRRVPGRLRVRRRSAVSRAGWPVPGDATAISFEELGFGITDTNQDGYGDVVALGGTSLTAYYGDRTRRSRTSSNLITPELFSAPAVTHLDSDPTLDLVLPTADGLLAYTSPFAVPSPYSFPIEVVGRSGGPRELYVFPLDGAVPRPPARRSDGQSRARRSSTAAFKNDIRARRRRRSRCARGWSPAPSIRTRATPTRRRRATCSR